MRLPILILIIVLMQMRARSFAQNVTLSISNQPITSVFYHIQLQTGYDILCSTEVIRSMPPVTINVRNVPLVQVLEKCFRNQVVSYIVNDKNRTVVIRKRNAESANPPASIITVSGIVSDSRGLPLEGVSVKIKGTTVGTATNASGYYRIAIKDPNAVLVFSYLGFTSHEIAVNGKTILDMSLAREPVDLGDVVVIGYGTQKKSELTGSVSSVSALEINEIPVVSLEKALQGRVAGVQVQQTSGQPGTGISLRIRGVSSIAGGNEPLYVIDGLPQFNDDVRGVDGLGTINPLDIQSIEVLKDASATAIYGSRGANGVVMITTKLGKVGPSVVSFQSSFGLQRVMKKIPMMNSAEYIDYVKRYYSNSMLPVPSDIANFTPTVSTDWQNEVFTTAPSLNNSLDFSGGSDKVRYYVSGSYLNQEGVVIRTGYQRGSARVNLDSKISDRVKLLTRFTVSRAVQNGFSPSLGDATRNFGKSGIGSTFLSSPVVPVKSEDGSYSNITPFSFNGIDAENPVALAKEVLDKNTNTRMQGGVELQVKPLDRLTNTTRFFVDFYDIRRDLYFPKILPRLGNNVGVAELGRYDKTMWLAEDFVDYRQSFSKNNLFEATLGVSLQRERNNQLDIAASGFANDDLKNYNFGAANTVNKPVSDVAESTIISAFARAHLNIGNKYLFTASLRRDGASVFAENNKYGFFPSVSAAWHLSEEWCFNNLRLFPDVKLRASWGEAGNPAISPYQSLSVGQVVNTGQGAGTGLAVGLSPTFPNPNLKWETTAQTNIGMDAGLFKERVRLTFDYYIKNTRNLLSYVQLAPSAGVNQVIENVGRVQNKGWELSVATDIIRSKDWGLALDFNISGNKNKVVKTKDNQDISASTGGDDKSGTNSIIRVGEPLSAFYGPRFIGLSAEGLPLHENLNGDKYADGTDKIDALDDQILGSPYPDLYYGVTSSFRYRRLSISTVWAGVGGSLINNQNLYNLTIPGVANQYNKAKVINKLFPKPSEVVNAANRRSSRFMESGDFFRLRNVRVDYSIHPARTPFKSLDLYLSGQNQLTFTKYSGFDPEVNSFNGNDRRQGIDLAAYPSAKVWTVGFVADF